MAITQTETTSFKKELLEKLHNFSSSGGDVFKLALYTSSATLNATTTVYTSTNEVVGTGYTAGGVTLTNLGTFSANLISFLDFADVSWPSSTITSRGALIYNSTEGNRSACVLDFGTDRITSNGTFTIIFPAPNSSEAIIRLD